MTASTRNVGYLIISNLQREFAHISGGMRLVMGCIILVVVCQGWLIFERAINWDEFLHFGQIYDLANGRLTTSLQSLHTRLFGWAMLVSQDVITQIQFARIAMLGCMIITASCVVILARRLVEIETALLSGLAYLTAGYVFTNAFTYRPDPVAAAALMGALCLFTFGTMSWLRIILSGILIGLAGALTIKSIFYAPCFAAIVYLHWRYPSAPRPRVLYRSAVLIAVAALFFTVIVIWHGYGLPAGASQGSGLGKKMHSFLHLFEFEQIRYVFAEMALAPLVTLGLILLIPLARGLSNKEKILLMGLCGPLLCIFFYRNTFPYFFTFLLPPICVAIAPVLSVLIKRYSLIPIIAFCLIGPVFLLAQEPYGTLERQRATINEIDRLFPEPTPYLSYSSYVPSYPRQFPSLISGVGLRRYQDERSGQIAHDIEAGRIAFVIATGDVLDRVYQNDGPVPMLTDLDVVALRNNFLRHSDTIFIAGKKICSEPQGQEIRIFLSGPYAVDGGDLVIGKKSVTDGNVIWLSQGKHKMSYDKGGCLKLWALDHVPQLPDNFLSGPIAGGF